MWVPKGVNFYTLFFTRYLPRLEAKSSEGDNLKILPLSELAVKLKTDEETLLNEIKKSIRNDVPIKNIGFLLLPKHDEENEGYYEEIVITWSEGVKKTSSSDFFTMTLDMNPIFIQVGDSSFYVDIQVNDKYRFEGVPTVKKEYEEKLYHTTFNSYMKMPENEYRIVLLDKRHYVYRFERGLSAKIQINFRIGVTEIVKQWSWVGFLLGIGVMPFLVWLFLRGDIVNAFPLGLAIIGLLVGFRILLLHDSELLKRWNWIYIGLVVLDSIILATMRIIGHDPDVQMK